MTLIESCGGTRYSLKNTQNVRLYERKHDTAKVSDGVIPNGIMGQQFNIYPTN